MTPLRSFGWLAGLLITLPAGAAQPPLPEPLTLAAALATAENPNHHRLAAIEQRLQALRAELGVAQGDYGFSLDLRGWLREVGPSDAAEDPDETNDNAASLVLSKPLYDFGRQSSREQALALRLDALELQKRLLTERRRLEILERYIAVLDADNDFIAENEALAIGFIRYDNAVEDLELGLVAEIDVLRLQSDYEKTRQARHLAQQRQRLTRALLAEAMGYPQHLPSTLEIPRFNGDRAIGDDVDMLVASALRDSLEVRVADARVRAAQATIAIAEASDNPSLDFEIEVSHYERLTSTRDDWRASLYFEIPLFSGADAPRVAQAQAAHREALADFERVRSGLRLEVLQLWQQIRQLELTADGDAVEREYRDRYLDRSRAEYELEFRTDLGDSMVLFSRSNAARLRTLYQLELAYRRLDRLVGAATGESTSPTQ